MAPSESEASVRAPAHSVQATGVSSVEVYGFVGWISSLVGYGLYLIWALSPTWLLHDCGITYYPNKYWAIAVPAWTCMAVLCGALLYESVNWAIPDEHDACSETAKQLFREGIMECKSSPPVFFNCPGDSQLPPWEEMPKIVSDAVFLHGADPSEAEAKWANKVQWSKDRASQQTLQPDNQ